MIEEYMEEAVERLQLALFEYESNGIRYEPSDRQALIDVTLEVERLGKILSRYMLQLPFLDSKPIGEPVAEEEVGSVRDAFRLLDEAKFISPEGPLEKHRAYNQLKAVFENTNLSVREAHYLLHREKSN